MKSEITHQEFEKAWLKGVPLEGAYKKLTEEISCDADAEAIQRVQSILEIVDYKIDWTDQSIRNVFPSWFSAKFRPMMTDDERASWIREWRALKGEAKTSYAKKRVWALEDWTDCLHPENRVWHIADIQEQAQGHYLIIAVVVDWPVPLGTLEVLLTYAGATNLSLI